MAVVVAYGDGPGNRYPNPECVTKIQHPPALMVAAIASVEPFHCSFVDGGVVGIVRMGIAFAPAVAKCVPEVPVASSSSVVVRVVRPVHVAAID